MRVALCGAEADMETTDKDERRGMKMVPPEEAIESSGPPPSSVTKVELVTSKLQVASSIAIVLTSLFTGVTAIATVALAWGVAFQLGDAKASFEDYKNQRRLANMERRHEDFSTPRMLYTRNRAAQKLGEGSPHIMVVFQFFEKLAGEWKAGVVTSEDVDFYFLEHVFFYWCGWREWVHAVRKDNGEDPENGPSWSAFQELHKEIAQAERRECWKGPEISDFATNELLLFDLELDYRAGLKEEPQILPGLLAD